MSSESQDARDTRDIESDLRHNRERIDNTIDKLQQKFTPGELFDQTLRYARTKNDDGTTSRLKDTVVRNPLPVALVGVGLAWLMLSGRDGSVPTPAGDTVRERPSPTRTQEPPPSTAKTAESAAGRGSTPPPAPSARSTPPPKAGTVTAPTGESRPVASKPGSERPA